PRDRRRRATGPHAARVAASGATLYDESFRGVSPACGAYNTVGFMLRGIRKASSNWLGKAVMGTVMGLLIISFAIWGIGDIFRGFGRSTVVKIGHTEITTEQFRQLYNDRLQQVSRQFGRVLTPDQIRALGLVRQVVTQIITEIALDERARQLRLGMTDAD